jgi:AI-2 transport protein TqsA
MPALRPAEVPLPSARVVAIAAVLIAFAVVLTTLHTYAVVFAPVVFAFFIVALTWPIQKRLQAIVPKLLALALTMMLTLGLLFAFGYLAAWSFSRAIRLLISDTVRLQDLYDQTASWFMNHGIILETVWGETLNVGWLLRTAQGITGRLNTTVTFWIVVVVYVLLGLMEVDLMERKVQAMANKSASAVLHRGSIETAARFRRYVVVRTLMSVLTGALVASAAAVAGLPLAMEWGTLAFVLNYIPFLGPLIATLLPSLFALAQSGSWETAAALFVGLNVIQFLIGSYLEPRVSGSAVAVSPFLVLFSVFLWGYVWGVSGAFIGVPITIALLTYCAEHPSTRWISDLLAAGDPPRKSKAESS